MHNEFKENKAEELQEINNGYNEQKTIVNKDTELRK